MPRGDTRGVRGNRRGVWDEEAAERGSVWEGRGVGGTWEVWRGLPGKEGATSGTGHLQSGPLAVQAF